MISNDSIFALDSIWDLIDLTISNKYTGYDLKMKIELIQDKIAELANKMFLAKEVATNSPVYMSLHNTFAMIENWATIKDIKQRMTGVSVLVKDTALFEEMPEFMKNKYKNPQKLKYAKLA